MARFDITLTDAAKEEARKCAEEGKDLRFSVSRSGCCSIAISIFPDAERDTDEVIEVDGIRIVTNGEYPDLEWKGTIDYKTKGLRKGFVWK
ncbi:MAG: hypothetical protein IJI20_06420 [Firmicutes bacterium]|nr:hypothetical protein [Bacillota bacterium]